ncbi:tautomerase family protein [Cupriavidus necator]|uniref:4-oxalocrotonate tautomerase n=1 Tax=Cupriavidus necator TaxID=106590 RepID=A0A1K0IM34_CUPNE|nr:MULTISPECIES: tautomerase family protein [Cupriavidus]RWA53334.1 4-oxalocrotonate tautomerase [Cupriavidus sp. UYMSc13B]EYS96349.1 4-oxalocrotonate tautomerase [Cupriavidus sp. SK-4]QQX83929.1 tautomerase family protein [Cupriavidus necator]RCJ09608.1 4-oxalocrotonate tautomerase [Cupriavidus necator]SCU85700.1 4-oxalocrotonate tautomerase-like protein [Cupriavidus necator]
MPHIVLHLSGQPDAALTRRSARAIADLTERVLGKKRDVIAVTVQYIPHDSWIIADVPLSEQGRNAFHLDISVTDETNTKAEKAQFIEAVFETMSGLLGKLHPVSYVHVIDARAAAYGYGGRTQEYRHQHG